MFHKILIANRGEIAIRIIRACQEMGIKSVAIFSTADRDSLHVALADEAICIGPANLKQSYLNIPAILAAAEVTGSAAIHPGYGFLSEDFGFAEKCIASKIDFIGPNHKVIALMGDKVMGRKVAAECNVPSVPGTIEAVQSIDELKQAMPELSFPLIIKAKDGGGGRGMRVVYEKSSFNNAFELARAESIASFNSPFLFVEKYIENPRHVEVQLIGDKKGNIIHLGDRDCSMQRRHQKIIEEAPAPGIPVKVRNKIHDAAIKIASKVKYFSAGTIEFLLDKNMNFYFIEMNTRLQVEHPVTEAITNLDLVKEQINVAAGYTLSLDQKKVKFQGHAIECRITAEDPFNMTPSPGKINTYWPPGGYGVRLDSGVYGGSTVLPYYDSMIAKLITHGKNREEARFRMLRALKEFKIEGIKTIIPLHRSILKSLYFKEAKLSTKLVQHFIDTPSS